VAVHEAGGMDRLLSCVSAELVDVTATDNNHHHHHHPAHHAARDKDAGAVKQLAVATGRLATFRHRLPPLTFLPCGVRPADPSPPASPGDPGDGSGGRAGGEAPVLTGGVQQIDDRYVVTALLGCGTFGSVLRAECRRTGRPTALKQLPKHTTKPADFRREYQYGLQMSLAMPAGIVATYDDAFETPTSYVLAQELAPCGDLLAAVSPPHRGGLGETRTKRVARQLAAALAFLHARRLVHRDVKPENVMLYDAACRLVKLGDFGVARRSGTVVCRVCAGTAYTAPEVCSRALGQTYRVDPTTDVWAFGVVLFALMTGNFPWRVAHHDADDRLYAEFVGWQDERRRDQPVSPPPEPWSRFTEPFVTLVHRLLETSPLRRASIDVVDRPVVDVAWTVHRVESARRRRPPARDGLRAPPHDHAAAPRDHAAASRDHAGLPRDQAGLRDHAAAPRDHAAAGRDDVAPRDHAVAPRDHAGPRDQATAALDQATGRDQAAAVREPRDNARLDSLMDAASRSDRVSHWLLNNKQLDSATTTS